VRLTGLDWDACNCLMRVPAARLVGYFRVHGHSLAGRAILVIEDEPIIALQLETQLNAAGARVYSAGRLRDALHMAEHPALSAAVLDYRLGADDSAAVCRRLTELGVPFLFYTGFSDEAVFHRWPDAPVVSKPVDARVLIDAVARLLH
jgi:DNA-binding response OmpR family regulator